MRIVVIGIMVFIIVTIKDITFWMELKKDKIVIDLINVRMQSRISDRYEF